MQCPRCGAQNAAGNLYCGNCGALLPPPGQSAPGLAGQQEYYQASGQPEPPQPYQAPDAAWRSQPPAARSDRSRVWLIALSLLLFGALALLLLVGSRLNARNASATTDAPPTAQVGAVPSASAGGAASAAANANHPAEAQPPASANAPANPPANKPAQAQPPAANAPANPSTNNPSPAQPPAANAPANQPPAAQAPAAANAPAPAPAQPAAPPAGPVDTGPQLTAARVNQPPAIDGNLGEWQGASQAVDAVVFGQENMSGVGDLGGRVWLDWDNNALYVAVLVIDDTLSQPSSGRQLYQGDSIEIQWDTNPPGNNPAAWDADDWHIGLSPGNFQDKPPESYVWTPRDGYGADMGVRMAARPFMNNGQYQGYTIEAAIPWALVTVQPKAGQTFRIAVSISDDDSPQAVQESMVSTSPGRQWHRPDTLNTLTLK